VVQALSCHRVVSTFEIQLGIVIESIDLFWTDAVFSLQEGHVLGFVLLEEVDCFFVTEEVGDGFDLGGEGGEAFDDVCTTMSE